MRLIDVCFWSLCAFNLALCAYVGTHRTQVAFSLIGADGLVSYVASHIHVEFGGVTPDAVDDRKIIGLPGRT